MLNQTPAEQLEGVELDGGWVVVRRLPESAVGSGGQFSVQYEAALGSQTAFVKALDINRALGDGGLLAAHLLTGDQWTEAALLHRCAAGGLSRIIKPIAQGVWTHPTDRAATPVPYLVLEWADGGDLSTLVSSSHLDVIVGLNALHGIACALQQLHAQQIAHRDVRPSNGLIVNGRIKLGDLGHARDLANTIDPLGPHGAAPYAPPEVLYGSLRETEAGLRAADLYLLGSLALSLVGSRVPLTTLWVCLLDDELGPMEHPGPLSAVLPFVHDAYDRALDFISNKVPPEVDPVRFMRLIRVLTAPDPDRRGFPQAGSKHNSLSLARVVTEIDLIRRRTALALTRP